MSYFATILTRHHLNGTSRSFQYLWQIKVTDEEYETLKAYLIQQFQFNQSFGSLGKECVLFAAEYWRREYRQGPHSVQMILEALGIADPERWHNEYSEAARSGLQELNLELLEGQHGRRFWDSILYQGGLPMQLIASNRNEGVWDRFTRQLVNKRIDFDELNVLSEVAQQSQCLKNYCIQLSRGVEAKDCEQMPFFCQNESDPWFVALIELANRERALNRLHHPFSLGWTFQIDEIERKIKTDYVVSGLQKLPYDFLVNQNLTNINFFSAQIRKNGQAISTFDYINNFCRYAVIYHNRYNDGDVISIFLHNQETPLMSSNLDMSTPHLLYKCNGDQYKLGNKIGNEDSLLLIPDQWIINDAENFFVTDYTWGDVRLKGIHITSDYMGNGVAVGSPDGYCVTFGRETALYWTEMLTPPLSINNIVEALYDVGRCRFKLCCETAGETISMQCQHMEYRNKRDPNWTDSPSFGEIFVRGTAADGNMVAPMKLINIGQGIDIHILSADNESCTLQTQWAHGRIRIEEGEEVGTNVWRIKKEHCPDNRKIHLVLTPDQYESNRCTLTFKAPFKDFLIMDINGNPVPDNSLIPYSDIDRYQYHLFGQSIPRYTYGNITRSLQWNEGNLFLRRENGERIRIPYEGSLLMLFDSREVLRAVLDSSGDNLLNAEVKISFTLENGTVLNFGIKEFPYRVRQGEDNRITVTGNHDEPVKFTNALELMRWDNPTESCSIRFDEEHQCYQLPETIRSWGNTLLIGRTRGRILPALVNFNHMMDDTDRRENRKEAMRRIDEEIQHACPDDQVWRKILMWFDKTQTHDIPASSILELALAARQPRSLLLLALHLYAKCQRNEEQEVLLEQLESFASDLAFQWYWLLPSLDDILSILATSDPHATMLQSIYQRWVLDNFENEKLIRYIRLPYDNDDEYRGQLFLCTQSFANNFKEWMRQLCIRSLSDTYAGLPNEISRGLAGDIVNCQITRVEVGEEYINFIPSILDENTRAFFMQYSESRGVAANEQWLYQRVNAVIAHLKGQLDLFLQHESIRRSIIYCSKSYNIHFITTLNNKLC